MVKWFNAYWAKDPHENERLNPFVIDFSLRPCELIGAYEAAIKAVNAIVAEYPPPYTLLVSGGVDSQVMVWAWMISNVPFTVVHYSYGIGTNTEDTDSVIAFCSRLKIPYQIRKFDAFEFIKSEEMVNYAKQFDCASPQISTYIKLVENHKYETVVMSGNYVDQKKCGINYTIYGLERYSQQEKPNFIPFFLLSQPELAYAFWKQEKEHWSTTTEHSIYSAKLYAYKRHNIPIIPQSAKLTGFEQMKLIADDYPVSSALKLRYNHMPSKRPFDLLYRYSLFDYIPRYTEETQVIHNQCTKD